MSPRPPQNHQANLQHRIDMNKAEFKRLLHLRTQKYLGNNCSQSEWEILSHEIENAAKRSGLLTQQLRQMQYATDLDPEEIRFFCPKPQSRL